MRASDVSLFVTAKGIIDLIFRVSEKHVDMLLGFPLYSNQINIAHRDRKIKKPVHPYHSNICLRQNILNKNDPNPTISIMKEPRKQQPYWGNHRNKMPKILNSIKL